MMADRLLRTELPCSFRALGATECIGESFSNRFRFQGMPEFGGHHTEYEPAGAAIANCLTFKTLIDKI
jgi:hypothetical protein